MGKKTVSQKVDAQNSLDLIKEAMLNMLRCRYCMKFINFQNLLISLEIS